MRALSTMPGLSVILVAVLIVASFFAEPALAGEAVRGTAARTVVAQAAPGQVQAAPGQPQAAAPGAPISPYAEPVAPPPAPQTAPAPYPYYAPPPPLAYSPPRVDHYEERRRYGLMTTGLIMFGVSWATTATIGYFADENRLIVPLAGPIWETAHYYDDSRTGVDGVDRFVMFCLVMDAALQTTGVVLTLVGALTKTKVPVYSNRVSLLPVASPGGLGLAAVGRF